MNGRHLRISAIAAACALASAFAIRAVSAAVPAVCFVVQSGTVYDARTKLTWQQVVGATTLSPDTVCSALGAGWRVPRTRELLSIVDYTRTNPAIDPVAFPNTPSEIFWTSSPNHIAPSGSGYVNFMDGQSAVASSMHGPWRVRCVR